MPETPNQNRIFRFGIFELDGSTGELRKDGKIRPRLQGQPLEVLLCLLERPGDVVTREELRQRLWPADTFVDYDHSMNTAINKLREALSDSAENPRFIQTIPRRGYRFIATSETMDVPLGFSGTRIVSPSSDSELRQTEVASGLSSEIAQEQGESSAPPTSPREKRIGVLSDQRELPIVPRAIMRFLFSLIQLMYLCFYVLSLAYLHRTAALLSQALQHSMWLFVLLLVTALVGIPVRLYLLSAALFGYSGLRGRFLTLFPGLFALDEIWALAPFLLVDRIGMGLAMAATAALLYVPFSQRSLLLMGEGNPRRAGNS